MLTADTNASAGVTMCDAPNGYVVLESALEHGFGESEIVRALSQAFAKVAYGKDGDVWACCGPDKNGNPLELLVDFAQEPPVVFHADRLTAAFEKMIRCNSTGMRENDEGTLQ
jgi:hypothetical protein